MISRETYLKYLVEVARTTRPFSAYQHDHVSQSE